MDDARKRIADAVSGGATEYLWEDLHAAIAAVFAEPFTRQAEEVMLSVLRFDGQLRLSESSELPHSMTPEDMLKSVAAQWVVRTTGLTHLPELRRVERAARSPALASVVRAVIQKVAQAKPAAGRESDAGNDSYDQWLEDHARGPDELARPATDELLRCHGPELFEYAVRVAGGNRDIAEAGYQDGCLEEWNGRTQYTPPNPWVPWVRPFIRRRTLDAMRKWHRTKQVDLQLPDGANEPDHSGSDGIEGTPALDASTPTSRDPAHLRDPKNPDPAKEAERKEDIQMARDCVAALPRELQEYFTLREVHDLTLEEIAERIGKSRATVARRCEEMRFSLTACLKRKMGGLR